MSDMDVPARRTRVRRSVSYVRETGLLKGPTKNNTARAVPVPAFLARLLETEVADRDGDALVFTSARGGGTESVSAVSAVRPYWWWLPSAAEEARCRNPRRRMSYSSTSTT
jgi:hypothetical protein